MENEKKELSPKQILQSYNGRKLRIMEVCGTHTHEIFRLGIRKLLPESIELISGPGCPVCVTPVGFIDEACCLALGDLHLWRSYQGAGNADESCRCKEQGCTVKDGLLAA